MTTTIAINIINAINKSSLHYITENQEVLLSKHSISINIYTLSEHINNHKYQQHDYFTLCSKHTINLENENGGV